MISPSPYIRWAAGLSAAGIVLSSLELLSMKKHFARGGLFAWESALGFRHARLRRLIGGMAGFGGYGALLLLCARATAAVACIGFALHGPLPVAVLWATLTFDLFFRFRSPDLTDGAEHLLTISLIACALAVCFGPSPLIFLAAQLSLIYAASGLSKLRQSGWRNGDFLVQILSTRTFGIPALANSLRCRPMLLMCLGRLVILWELTWAFAPWLPPHFSTPLLVIAFGFHLGPTVVMG